MAQTHDLGSNTICQTVSFAISSQNQLVMRKTLKSFMVFDITPRGLIFRVVVGSQIIIPLTGGLE